MATSVVSNLDFSLPESMRTTQRQALYLQYATKTTGLSTCITAGKVSSKRAFWRSSKSIREPK